MKWPRFRHRLPDVPDDRDEREEKARETAARVARSQQIRTETIPLASTLNWYLARNHFAEKIASTYQLKKG